MAEREIRIHNKSDRPDNVIKKENDMYLECEKLEDGLPRFLRGFFSYLKGNVLPATRLAYLHDIMFFFKYLIEETDLTQAKTPDKIKLSDLEEVQAVDVNIKSIPETPSTFTKTPTSLWHVKNPRYRCSSNICITMVCWIRILPTVSTRSACRVPANGRSRRCRMTR